MPSRFQIIFVFSFEIKIFIFYFKRTCHNASIYFMSHRHLTATFLHVSFKFIACICLLHVNKGRYNLRHLSRDTLSYLKQGKPNDENNYNYFKYNDELRIYYLSHFILLDDTSIFNYMAVIISLVFSSKVMYPFIFAGECITLMSSLVPFMFILTKNQINNVQYCMGLSVFVYKHLIILSTCRFQL